MKLGGRGRSELGDFLDIDGSFDLLGVTSVAVLLGVRKKEQVQQVDVLHERDAELVQQDHQPLLDVRRVDFVLARVQNLQEGS